MSDLREALERITRKATQRGWKVAQDGECKEIIKQAEAALASQPSAEGGAIVMDPNQVYSSAQGAERLKEAEWCEKAVCTHRCLERGFDEHVPNCKSTILRAHIEQLKRGEL